MNKNTPRHKYPPGEERFNVISHAFGFVLSIIGLILLILKAVDWGEAKTLVSFSIFGGSMILLYAASTFYHSAKNIRWRYRLNILDHASIYILIAGTYTPFALVTLDGAVGWTIFGVVWALALIGVVLKLFYTGKYNRLSTIMYVAMGWLIIFAMKPLVENLSSTGLMLLIGGGLSYTIGAVFFLMEKLKFNHGIFHIFVLGGTFCHFLAIYFYVLPVIP